MINHEIQTIIRGRLHLMRSWKDPEWHERDIYCAVCGAVIKYAESRGQEITDELVAVIETVTRREMEK